MTRMPPERDAIAGTVALGGRTSNLRILARPNCSQVRVFGPWRGEGGWRRKVAATLTMATSRLVPVLTSQPFQPKLRHSKHMHRRAQRIRVLALLLGILFLGAQFHFCKDLTAAPSASHICPVCSTAGSAVATHSPGIAIIPENNPLEIVAAILSVSSAVPCATSPRAPPAL